MEAFRMYAPTLSSPRTTTLTGSHKPQRVRLSGGGRSDSTGRARTVKRKSVEEGGATHSPTVAQSASTTTTTTATTTTTNHESSSSESHSPHASRDDADIPNRRESALFGLSAHDSPYHRRHVDHASTAEKPRSPTRLSVQNGAGRRLSTSAPSGRRPPQPSVVSSDLLSPHAPVRGSADDASIALWSPVAAALASSRPDGSGVQEGQASPSPRGSSPGAAGESHARVSSKTRLVYLPRYLGGAAVRQGTTGRTSGTHGTAVSQGLLNDIVTARLPPGSPLATIDAMSPYARSVPSSTALALERRPPRHARSTHRSVSAPRSRSRSSTTAVTARKVDEGDGDSASRSKTRTVRTAHAGATQPGDTQVSVAGEDAAAVSPAPTTVRARPPTETAVAARKRVKKKLRRMSANVALAGSAPRTSTEENHATPRSTASVRAPSYGTVVPLPPATSNPPPRVTSKSSRAHEQTLVEVVEVRGSLTSLPALPAHTTSPQGSNASSLRSRNSSTERGRPQDPLVAIAHRSDGGNGVPSWQTPPPFGSSAFPHRDQPSAVAVSSCDRLSRQGTATTVTSPSPAATPSSEEDASSGGPRLTTRTRSARWVPPSSKTAQPRSPPVDALVVTASSSANTSTAPLPSSLTQQPSPVLPSSTPRASQPPLHAPDAPDAPDASASARVSSSLASAASVVPDLATQPKGAELPCKVTSNTASRILSTSTTTRGSLNSGPGTSSNASVDLGVVAPTMMVWHTIEDHCANPINGAEGASGGDTTRLPVASPPTGPHTASTSTPVRPHHPSVRGSSSLGSHLSHDSVSPHFLHLRLLSSTALYNSHVSSQPTPLADSHSAGAGTTWSNSTSGVGMPVSTLLSPRPEVERGDANEDTFFSDQPLADLPRLLSTVSPSAVATEHPSSHRKHGVVHSAHYQPRTAMARGGHGRTTAATGNSTTTTATTTARVSHKPLSPSQMTVSVASASATSTTAMWVEPLSAAMTSLGDLMKFDSPPHPLTAAASIHSVNDDSELGGSTRQTGHKPMPSSTVLGSSICSAATLAPGKSDSSGSLKRRAMKRRPRPDSLLDQQSNSQRRSEGFGDESEDVASTLGSRSRRTSLSSTIVLIGAPEALKHFGSRRSSSSVTSSTNPPLSSRGSNVTAASIHCPRTAPTVAASTSSSTREGAVTGEAMGAASNATSSLLAKVSSRTHEGPDAPDGSRRASGATSAASERRAPSVLAASSSVADTDDGNEWVLLPLDASLCTPFLATPSSTIHSATHMAAVAAADVPLRRSPMTSELGGVTAGPGQSVGAVVPQSQSTLTSILVGGSLQRAPDRPSATPSGPDDTANSAAPSRPCSRHHFLRHPVPSLEDSRPDSGPLIQFVYNATRDTTGMNDDGSGGTGVGASSHNNMGHSGRRATPSFTADSVSPGGTHDGSVGGYAGSLGGTTGAGALTHSMSLMSRGSLCYPTFPEFFMNSGTSASGWRSAPSGSALRPSSQPFTPSIGGEAMSNNNSNNKPTGVTAGVNDAIETDGAASAQVGRTPSFFLREDDSNVDVQKSLSLTALGRAVLQPQPHPTPVTTTASNDDGSRNARDEATAAGATAEARVDSPPPLFVGQGQRLVDYWMAWQRVANDGQGSAEGTRDGGLWQPTSGFPFGAPRGDAGVSHARAFSLFSNPNSTHDKSDEEPWVLSPNDARAAHDELPPYRVDTEAAQEALKRWHTMKTLAATPHVTPSPTADSPLVHHQAATFSSFASDGASVALENVSGRASPGSEALSHPHKTSSSGHGTHESGSGSGSSGSRGQRQPRLGFTCGGGGGFHSILTDMMLLTEEGESSRSLLPGTNTPGPHAGGWHRGNNFVSLLAHGAAKGSGRPRSSEGAVGNSGGGAGTTWHSAFGSTGNSAAGNMSRHRQSSSSSSSGSRATLQTLNRLGASLRSGQRQSGASAANTSHGSLAADGATSAADRATDHVSTNSSTAVCDAADTPSTASSRRGSHGDGTADSQSALREAAPSIVGKRSFRRRRGTLGADKTHGLTGSGKTASAGPSRRSGAVVQLREPSPSTISPLAPPTQLKIFDGPTLVSASASTSVNANSTSTAHPPDGTADTMPGTALMISGGAYGTKGKKPRGTDATRAPEVLSQGSGSATAPRSRRGSHVTSDSGASTTSAADVPSPNVVVHSKRRRHGEGGSPASTRTSSTNSTHSSPPAPTKPTLHRTADELHDGSAADPSTSRRGSPVCLTAPVSLAAPPSVHTTKAPLSPTALASGVHARGAAAGKLGEGHEEAVSTPLRDVYATMRPNFNGTLLSLLSPDDQSPDFLVSASEPHSLMVSQSQTAASSRSSLGAALTKTLSSGESSGARPDAVDATVEHTGDNDTHQAVQADGAPLADGETVGPSDHPLWIADSPDTSTLRIRSPDSRVDGRLNSASRNGHAPTQPSQHSLNVAEGKRDQPAQPLTASEGIQSSAGSALSSQQSVSSADRARGSAGVGARGDAVNPLGVSARGEVRTCDVPAPPPAMSSSISSKLTPAPAMAIAVPSAGSNLAASVPRLSTAQSEFSALMHKFNGPGGVNDSSLFGDLLPSVYLDVGASVSTTSLQIGGGSAPEVGEGPLPASYTTPAFVSNTSSSGLLRPGTSTATAHAVNHAPVATAHVPVAKSTSATTAVERTPKWRDLKSHVRGGAGAGSNGGGYADLLARRTPSPLQISLTADGSPSLAAAGESVVSMLPVDQSLSSVIPSLLYAPRELQSELRKGTWAALFVPHGKHSESRRVVRVNGVAAAGKHTSHHPNGGGSAAPSDNATPATSISTSSSQRIISPSVSTSVDLTLAPENSVLAVRTTNLRELLGLEPLLPGAGRVPPSHAYTAPGLRAGGTSKRWQANGTSREQSSVLAGLSRPTSGEEASRLAAARLGANGGVHGTGQPSCRQSPPLRRHQVALTRPAATTNVSVDNTGTLSSDSCEASSVLMHSEMRWPSDGRAPGQQMTSSRHSADAPLLTVTPAANSTRSPEPPAATFLPPSARDGRHNIFLSVGSPGARGGHPASPFNDNADVSLRSLITSAEVSPLPSQMLGGAPVEGFTLTLPVTPVEVVSLGTPMLNGSSQHSDVVVVTSGLSASNRSRCGDRRDSATSNSTLMDAQGRRASVDSLSPGTAVSSGDDRLVQGIAKTVGTVSHPHQPTVAVARRRSSKAASTNAPKPQKTPSTKSYKRRSGSSSKPRRAAVESSEASSITAAPKAPRATGSAGGGGGSSGAATEGLLFSPPFTPFTDLVTSALTVAPLPPTAILSPTANPPRTASLVSTHGVAALGDDEAQRLRLVPPPAAPSNTLNPRVSLGRDSSAFPQTVHTTTTTTNAGDCNDGSTSSIPLDERRSSRATSTSTFTHPSPLPGSMTSRRCHGQVSPQSSSSRAQVDVAQSHSSTSLSIPAIDWEHQTTTEASTL